MITITGDPSASTYQPSILVAETLPPDAVDLDKCIHNLIGIAFGIGVPLFRAMIARLTISF